MSSQAKYNWAQFKRLFEEGLSVSAISKKTGADPATIRYALKKFGITFRGVNRPQPQYYEKIRELHAKKLSIRKISIELGLTRGQVSYALKKMKLKPNFAPFPDMRRVNRQKVWEMLNEGYEEWEIAKILKCKPNTIRIIRLEEFGMYKIRREHPTAYVADKARITLATTIYNMKKDFTMEEIMEYTGLTREMVKKLFIEAGERIHGKIKVK
jgi:hypothetical protein